jgi:hypothetical protein
MFNNVEVHVMCTKENTPRSKRLFRSSLAIAAVCLGLHLNSATAPAQVRTNEPLDRPVEELFIGQTGYTQPQGSTQMILSGSQGRTGDLRNTNVIGRVEYGVTNNLQLQAELPFDITDRSSNFEAQTGVSRAQVGAKYNFMDRINPVALSAGVDVEFPLGTSDDVTGDRPSQGPTYKPSLIVAGGTGITTVHASAQAELGQPSRAFKYSVGSMFKLGSWVPTKEFKSRAQDKVSPEFYATPGLTYKFSDRAQIGAGAAIGLNDQSEDVRAVAKISLQLP